MPVGRNISGLAVLSPRARFARRAAAAAATQRAAGWGDLAGGLTLRTGETGSHEGTGFGRCAERRARARALRTVQQSELGVTRSGSACARPHPGGPPSPPLTSARLPPPPRVRRAPAQPTPRAVDPPRAAPLPLQQQRPPPPPPPPSPSPSPSPSSRPPAPRRMDGGAVSRRAELMDGWMDGVLARSLAHAPAALSLVAGARRRGLRHHRSRGGGRRLRAPLRRFADCLTHIWRDPARWEGVSLR
eukprot:scaffold753_cov320-Prasinococcus_capsulatus_cf.AAC.3